MAEGEICCYRMVFGCLEPAYHARAEGLGIRAVGRVFDVEANTVLSWLIEAANHAEAVSAYLF